ncbi:hypothetical protein EVAR_46905_1 [Eumeta japonica]|uniref:Uncharacterized protein n=1 Tax=Eumeta variegata TaxID=151549 RepID=A0A4C1Y2F1_EUMVA|nr:hypothetical protein EVAR_46905_1 [Eumeta japonica]
MEKETQPKDASKFSERAVPRRAVRNNNCFGRDKGQVRAHDRVRLYMCGRRRRSLDGSITTVPNLRATCSEFNRSEAYFGIDSRRGLAERVREEGGSSCPTPESPPSRAALREALTG